MAYCSLLLYEKTDYFHVSPVLEVCVLHEGIEQVSLS